MKLSKESLSFLTKALPKMRFSNIVLLSQYCGADLTGLLNIRAAGRGQSFLAAPKYDESVIEMDYSELEEQEEKKSEKKSMSKSDKKGEGQINLDSLSALPDFLSYLKSIVQRRYANDTKSKLAKEIGPNANEIISKLESQFVTKGSVGDDFKENSKKVKEFAKASGLTGDAVKMADAYVSLLRLSKGYLDDTITNIITKIANKEFSSGLLNKYFPSVTDGINAIVTALQLGRKHFSKTFLPEDIEIDPGKTDKLEEYLTTGPTTKDKEGNLVENWYVSAAAIISAIKQQSNSFAKNLYREISKKDKGETSMDAEVEGEEGDVSKYSVTPDPKAKDPSVAIEKKEAISLLQKAKDRAMKEIRIRDPLQKEAFEFAMDDAEKHGYKAGTTQQYKADPKVWEKYEMYDLQDFLGKVKPHFIKFRERMDQLLIQILGRDYMKVLTSSKLSHQLLIRAAGEMKIKLASKISKINIEGTEGNAKVYEDGKPQFAHEFYWRYDDGKINIAEVQDIDEEHINEAYQAAFEAVQQELFINKTECDQENM